VQAIIAGVLDFELHAALKAAGHEAHEGDAVAMVGIHVGLDLEHEGRHGWFVSLDATGIGLLGARRRRIGGKTVEQVADAEVLQRAAKEHRRQVALPERDEIERAAGCLDDGEFLGKRGGIEIGIERCDCAKSTRRARPVTSALVLP
jgi:predicted metal-dependent hydrolase